MTTSGEGQPTEDEMLPDEAAVLPERGEALDEADEGELLTTDEVAENLGFDAE